MPQSWLMQSFQSLAFKGKKMSDPICLETGTLMKRGVAPMTISYKDQSATFEMPSWYCDEWGESIHTGEDMKVSDRMLDQLKARLFGRPRTPGPRIKSGVTFSILMRASISCIAPAAARRVSRMIASEFPLTAP